MTNNNIWLIVLPILLFLLKNFFPLVCERVFSDHNLRGVWEKTIEELLQFPVDLLFIAISYTAPKIIDTIYALSNLKSDSSISSEKLIELNYQYSQNLINYNVRCFVMLIMLPVFVLLTKLAIKLGDEQKQKQQIIVTLALYLISLGAVVYSLFLYQ